MILDVMDVFQDEIWLWENAAVQDIEAISTLRALKDKVLTVLAKYDPDYAADQAEADTQAWWAAGEESAAASWAEVE